MSTGDINPPPMSPQLKRLVAIMTAVLIVIAAFDAWLIARLQPSAGNGAKSDAPAEFIGTLTRTPYPMLRVDQSGRIKTYLLVADDKRGADAALGVTPDGSVKLKGFLLERAGVAAIELMPDDTGFISESPEIPDPPRELHGTESFEGEIVASKCWLGDMRPGEGHIHRGCASLCIRGGIPPLFVVRGGGDNPRVFLMTQSDGRAIDPEQILPYVADHIRLTGVVEKRGDLFVLKVDLMSLMRVE